MVSKQVETDEETEEPYEELKETIAVPPMFTTFRINTLKSDRESVQARLEELLTRVRHFVHTGSVGCLVASVSPVKNNFTFTRLEMIN